MRGIEFMRSLRSLAALVALATALLTSTEDVDARVGSGFGFGGRGAATFMSPRLAYAAPNAGAPNGRVAMAQAGPSVHPGGSLTELFNRPGLLGGFAAGFLGAGLLGVLFGHGMFGGLGGVPSFLGLTFQLALVAMLGRLIWTWFSGRHAAVSAGLSPRQQAEPYLRSRNELLPGVYPLEHAEDETRPESETMSSAAFPMKDSTTRGTLKS